MKELLRLNPLLWRYKWQLLAGCGFILASNFLAVYSVDYVREGTNIIAELQHSEKTDSLKKGLLYASGLLIAFALASSVMKFGMRQMIIVASRKIEFDLKNDIYNQYQRLSQGFYKNNKTGDLMNRITEDVAHVRMYLGPGLMYPVNLISLFVILFLQMYSIDKELTIYMLAPMPILSVLIYAVARIINEKSKVLQEQQSAISSFVQDSFAGVRVVKAFNTQGFLKKSYEKEADEYEKRALSLATTEAFFFPLMILIVGISNLLILYIGGKRYISGDITEIGILAQFFIYLNMLIWPFTALGWVTMVVQRAAASMKRINEFMDVQPDIVNRSSDIFELEGRVEFDAVSYRYTNTGILALDNISFSVEPGQTVAILGRTGSGKTTLIQMLSRLFEPDRGEIRIDGTPIKKLNLEQLRGQIGFVPQEAFLFSDTLENNILFGLDKKERATAELYAKRAVVHSNIVGFQMGYDTVIGERGVTLSGGQKQRVSIARALAVQPRMLVFDDSLSAVDTETEEQILASLEREAKGKTTFIVTHRVSSAKNADLILILDQGRLVERGTHDELIAQDGLYAELYSKQLA